MPGLKDELASRGWMLRAHGPETPPFTHLFLDGGRAAIPDSMHGAFLNMYVNAILRGERVFVVETKTSLFKLFFDVDARYAGDPDDALKELTQLAHHLNDLVAEFWVCDAPKCIACTAPIKRDPSGDGSFKVGVHLHWPDIVTNSPIAMAFRTYALESLKESFVLHSKNHLEDVLDSCVFKANGLRLLYSGKVDEYRAYTPFAVLKKGEEPDIIPQTIGVDAKRKIVHECSIRAFDLPITPCRNGIDKLADDTRFAHARHRMGTQVRLEEYKECIPKLQALLPKVYATQRFTGVFRTAHAVMLKSSSRFCHNVMREHRTSTVYFVLSRRGMAQRCYCRKDENGCVEYCGEWIQVPDDILDAILPASAIEEDHIENVHIMPSKKRSVDSLHSLLGRCKPKAKQKKGKAGKQAKAPKKR